LPPVRPARRSGTVSFGGTRTSSSPTLNSCCSSQPVSCRQSSTAQRRSPSSAAAQPSSSSPPTPITFSSSGLPASSTATAVTDCLCTSSPSTIICIAAKPLAATGERTDLNRGPTATLLPGHARPSRSATATQRCKVRPPGRHSESSQPSPTESLQALGRRHRGDFDIEFRNARRGVVCSESIALAAQPHLSSQVRRC
jgi:hypothetical protein